MLSYRRKSSAGKNLFPFRKDSPVEVKQQLAWMFRKRKKKNHKHNAGFGIILETYNLKEKKKIQEQTY